MSLISLAVDQIQRPSFLLNFEPANHEEYVRGTERMDAIIAALRTAATPVSTAWIVETCQISRSTVQSVLQKLCDQNTVRRSSRVIDGKQHAIWSLT